MKKANLISVILLIIGAVCLGIGLYFKTSSISGAMIVNVIGLACTVGALVLLIGKRMLGK